ncbi:MAG: signal recognition particle-docking protein FtsY [Nitrososphaerota archaeon]
MLEGLKRAVQRLADALSGRPSWADIERALEEFRLALLQADVAYDVAGEVVEGMRAQLKQREAKGDAAELVWSAFQEYFNRAFSSVPSFDLMQEIERSPPCAILFLGVNGVGKTSAVAKLAHYLKARGKSVLLAAADTHRPGAIEQLAEHAARLGLRMISQGYNADPAAVARDAVEHARAKGYAAVLIDTAGRLQTYRGLMEEMAKIIRVARPQVKLFVCDALTGNDALRQAQDFLRYTDYNGIVLTKLDSDAKGGVALTLVKATGRPILFASLGQRYEDFRPFEPSLILERLAEVKPGA